MSQIDKQTKKRGQYILYTSRLSAEGAKVCSKKRKCSTILPISIVQSFFCVLFFSFCSNLSIWPGRQVFPYESRCYTPIFDGLVQLYHGSFWVTLNQYSYFFPIMDHLGLSSVILILVGSVEYFDKIGLSENV